MRIRVLYNDNSSGFVDDFRLDALIDTGKVVAFFRSDGWVAVGRDPVRTATGGSYLGPDRRKKQQRIT